MNRTRLAVACYVALATALITWTACRSDRVDAHCSANSPGFKTDPSCIYGGNGELAPFNEGACAPDGDAGMPPMPAVCPAPADVFAFFTDEARGNCSASACHGTADDPAAGIFLDKADPQQFYAMLTTVKGTVGKPYLVPGPTAYQDSWILCNVTAKTGGGYPMPPASGVPNRTDADTIRDWLLCGAPGLQ